MRMNAAQCALVLVDYQQRLMPVIAGQAECVETALFLAQVAQALDVPVIGTEQNPSRLGGNVERLKALCGVTVEKMHFDATADGLLDALQQPDGTPLRQVIVGGCEAHVCLLQTALGLLSAGLSVFVVVEACGSRRPSDHAAAMQRLAQAGATLVTAEMVAFEWVRSCEAPAFKAVLERIKGRTL